jgi:hypothetical protein
VGGSEQGIKACGVHAWHAGTLRFRRNSSCRDGAARGGLHAPESCLVSNRIPRARALPTVGPIHVEHGPVRAPAAQWPAKRQSSRHRAAASEADTWRRALHAAIDGGSAFPSGRAWDVKRWEKLGAT